MFVKHGITLVVVVATVLLAACAAPAPPTVSTAPTLAPMAAPVASSVPTAAPPRVTAIPSVAPSVAPTAARTAAPTTVSAAPSALPTLSAAAKAALHFDGQQAFKYALDQCAIGPRPPGTPAIQKTRDYIIQNLQANGWTVEQQKFNYRGVDGVNIIGKRGTGPITIIGAHYDTRPVADQDPDPAKQKTPIMGGNDGASGVAVLLELARTWRETPPPGETWLSFFDLEDSGELNGWPWGVGSDYMAGHLTTQPKQMILVDMVGDSDQQIYLERTSDQKLLRSIFDVAQSLGYGQWFIPQPRHALLDDHTPFLERHISAVDIIDFDYPYHHTVADDCTKIAADSMERVGRTLEQFMKQGG
ncbi:MAG: M28 family peptidase [Anaerolineae bacterium]